MKNVFYSKLSEKYLLKMTQLDKNEAEEINRLVKKADMKKIVLKLSIGGFFTGANLITLIILSLKMNIYFLISIIGIICGIFLIKLGIYELKYILNISD